MVRIFRKASSKLIYTVRRKRGENEIKGYKYLGKINIIKHNQGVIVE